MTNEDKFKLDLLPGGYQKIHYNNGDFINWPTCIKITLDGVVLDMNHSGGQSDYQNPGHLWQPGFLLSDGTHVLENSPHYFSLNNTKNTAQLRFEPEKNDQVKISLDKKYTDLEKITFDHEQVNNVLVNKEHASLEFYKLFNDIVKDVAHYKDWKTLNSLIEDFDEILLKEDHIKSLFEKYGVPVANIPKEFREYQRNQAAVPQ